MLTLIYTLILLSLVSPEQMKGDHEIEKGMGNGLQEMVSFLIERYQPYLNPLHIYANS